MVKASKLNHIKGNGFGTYSIHIFFYRRLFTSSISDLSEHTWGSQLAWASPHEEF